MAEEFVFFMLILVSGGVCLNYFLASICVKWRQYECWQQRVSSSGLRVPPFGQSMWGRNVNHDVLCRLRSGFDGDVSACVPGLWGTSATIL